MAKNKSRPVRLGKGLSALMSGSAADASAFVGTAETTGATDATEPDERDRTPTADVTVTAEAHRAATDMQIIDLSISAVRPNPDQPRKDFDQAALDRLASSIQSVGLVQPIVVRPLAGSVADRYIIVAGERRWRAARLAGLTTIPAVVRDLDDADTAQWALVENLQREDLNPIERAQGFDHLIKTFGYTQDRIAKYVGVERPTIANALRLLNLHPDVQTLVKRGALSGGQAKALAGLADPTRQLDMAKRVVQQNWSVRQVESAVQLLAKKDAHESPTTSTPAKPSTYLTDLEHQIGQQLGTNVQIRTGRKKGTGTLSISFYNLDQFDDLMQRLGVNTK